RALSASVHGALVLQTRLSGYLDAIEIVIDETGLHLQASALHSRLDERRADNATEALLDLAELVRYARGTLLVAGVDGFTKLSGWMAELGADDPTRAALAEMGWVLDPTKSGSKDADMMWGSAAADTLRLAGVTGDDVDALYLTGGSTGLAPLVRDIAARCPRARVIRGDRYASVAQGLGVHARRVFG
ncbi:MAG: hypothetical protein L6Q98_25365, partial [Anaerolineae bacterium]|nr:hypothetical protein [Anaerolineae bacterium]